jgi:regulator of cell morphogenesis and NO signaling
MTTCCADTTVGQIAANLPISARIFEKYGIDFCCGGRVPLAEACQQRGLDPAAVLEEIDRTAQAPAAEPETAWRTATLTSLAGHIVETHHGYMKTQLPRLEAMLQKIVDAHSARHSDVLAPLAATYRAMKEELDGHLLKEEMILFPLIRALESGFERRNFYCGSVQNPIRMMVMEHDSAGGALARMRQLTASYTPPPDACNTFRAFYFELAAMEADLHQHIHLENNILFPRAIALESARP